MIQLLLDLLRREDTIPADTIHIANALYRLTLAGSQERQEAIEMLIELTRWPDLTFEDALVVDDRGVSLDANKASVTQQLAAKEQMWKTIAQRPDLTPEQ